MAQAAIGVVGLGLSAVSTIDSAKRANAERERQNAILDNQLLELEDRLSLAKMHNEATNKGAQLLRDRERQIINAQKVQSDLAVQEQMLQSQLERLNARLAARGIESQAQVAASQLLAQAANEGSELLTQGANELEAASSAFVPASASSGSKTSVANESRALSKVSEVQNRLAENAEIAKRTAQVNQDYAKTIGELGIGMAGVQAGFIGDQISAQSQSDELYRPFALRQNQMTGRRNQMASKSAKESRIASSDMNLLSQQAQALYGRNAIEAQRPAGGSNFLSGLAQVGTTGLSLAGQLGLFGGGQSTPTQSGSAGGGWSFGSQRLGVYSGNFDRSFVDTPVGIAGTSKSNLGIK